MTAPEKVEQREVNPLVARIVAVRHMIDGLEAQTRKDRDLIMRQSIFLRGLETAASLVLGSDELSQLLEHQRTGKMPA